MLTVTEEVQKVFLIIVVRSFQEACRKLRASARGKARMPVSEWDSVCSYSCVMVHVKAEAQNAGSDKSVLDALDRAMLAKDYFIDVMSAVAGELPAWKVQHLACWQELVDVKSKVVDMAGQDAVNLDMVQEEAAQAHFKALRAQIASLGL